VFNHNEPASTIPAVFQPDNSRISEGAYYGFTKFEQCAKEFTAAALPWMMDECRVDDTEASVEAVRIGIQTAEEFCRQMEEREK
jgi:hypothetical protein